MMGEIMSLSRLQVRLTFCNMRQNIHDRRRKRGGPGRKKSTEQRRPSTEAATPLAQSLDLATASAPHCSPLPCLSEVEEQLSPKEVEDECISTDQEDAAAATTVKHASPVLPSETSSILRSYLQSHGMSSSQQSSDEDDCDPLLNAAADEVCSSSLRGMAQGNNCEDAILDEDDRISISR